MSVKKDVSTVKTRDPTEPLIHGTRTFPSPHVTPLLRELLLFHLPSVPDPLVRSVSYFLRPPTPTQTRTSPVTSATDPTVSWLLALPPLGLLRLLLVSPLPSWSVDTADPTFLPVKFLLRRRNHLLVSLRPRRPHGSPAQACRDV